MLEGRWEDRTSTFKELPEIVNFPLVGNVGEDKKQMTQLLSMIEVKRECYHRSF